MSIDFRNRIKSFSRYVKRFDENSFYKKKTALNNLTGCRLTPTKSLITYHDLLLFIVAFPPNKEILSIAELELSRISTFVRKLPLDVKKILTNSGLPFISATSSFSFDFVSWLQTHSHCRIISFQFLEPAFNLNEVLAVLLPSPLQTLTTAGYSTDELFNVLGVKPKDRLRFLITEFQKLNDQPTLRDMLFDSLGLYIEIQSENKSFSRTFNRVLRRQVSFHDPEILKYEPHNLINKKIETAIRLSIAQKKSIVRIIKNTMALAGRETDTVTYMDDQTMRYYKLEKGVSIALYGMIAERQLPYESYVGYTLFKNGVPVAYGGGWVFGERAAFGINIFEPFRGGESGFLFCQLLRLYHQVFGVIHFEVEPYQFGAENEEGIHSGAFWFYYKFGFKPVQHRLKQIAAREWKKISNRKNYHSSKGTLIKLAADNLAFSLQKSNHIKISQITEKIRRMIRDEFQNDTVIAESICKGKFMKAFDRTFSISKREKKALAEMALWAAAFSIHDKEKLKLMQQMIRCKPADPYRYQTLLSKLLLA